MKSEPLAPADAQGRAVELMYKVTGQDWMTIDLSNSPAFIFCRDVNGGDIEKAVLVFSNGDIEATDGPKEAMGSLPPFLWFDNVGCRPAVDKGKDVPVPADLERNADAVVESAKKMLV